MRIIRTCTRGFIYELRLDVGSLVTCLEYRRVNYVLLT